MVLFISNQVQDHYWESQQRFLAQQARINKRIESASATQEQLVTAVGEVLTGEAVIVGAHEQRFGTEQLDKSIDEYNALKDRWDRTEEGLRLRMQLFFPSSETQLRWVELQRELEHMDAEIQKLEAFKTTDVSQGHQNQISRCRAQISQLEARLAELARYMTRDIGSIAEPKGR
jgi:hypothetical protein